MADQVPVEREIELKLRARPEDLHRLKTAPALAGAKSSTRTLENTYFDTPDLVLHGRGVSLRVRRVGRKLVQTLKAPTDIGETALARPEWETPVPGPAPDLSLLPAEALTVLEGIDPQALGPVFASTVKRTTCLLTPAEGVCVEVAIDQGEITAPDGRTAQLTELELELKQGGDAATLYAIARDLTETAPLWVETKSKARRGFDLATGAAGGWSKADALELPRDATVEEAFARIVRHCLAHMLDNEACALSGERPEGIHQMRVALRRLRSALSTFRDVLPPEQAATLGAEVKWLASSFGPARDWDVFLSESLRPVDKAFPGEASLRALEKAARAARERGYVQARGAILSMRYTRLLLDLGAWVDGRGWRGDPARDALLDQRVTDFADAMLEKRHRQARKRGRGFATLPTEKRHQLRIALKKLRYAAEFFRSLYPEKAVRRYLKDLAALQEALGRLNDTATLHRLVDELEAARGPAGWRLGAGMVLGWRGHGAAQAEGELVADWKRFKETEPFWAE
ncbi:MAG TPA: CYTH and CHAD domain-containing protein [Azospirillaceae bacterium]|nr:CYTH and CHAD domain-containing protein [Azospirillaceae bacterium]